MLRDYDFVALRPEWILRNDGSQVILHLMSHNESSFAILTPEEAALAPLLDGQHTVAELSKSVRYVFNFPSNKKARTHLENVVQELNADREKVAVLDKPAAWRVNYNPLDYIVSRDKYEPNMRLARPISLLVYFSGWCQTNCVYCYADLRNMRRLKHLPLEQWLRIMHAARELDIRIIELTGGDTLGRPESILFCKNLIKLGFLFLLSTKCYISLADAQQLANAGFEEPVCGVKRELQISVDSPNSTVADYLVGRKGYLERATQTICNLLAVGISPIVKAVVTPLNYRQVQDHIRFFRELGVHHFRFATYGRSHYRHNDNLFASDDIKSQTADLLNAVANEHPELEIEGDSMKFVQIREDDQAFREKRWADRVGCSAGRTMLGVAPDGQAVLCEQMPLTSPYFVGDLTRQSILEVWNSPELLNFIYPQRERFFGTPCYECPEFAHCIYEQGQCFRDSFFAYDQLYNAPPDCPRRPAGSYRTM